MRYTPGGTGRVEATNVHVFPTPPGHAATLLGVVAVLLDMDGTLVDSQHVSDRCWTRWCRRRAKDLPAVLSLSRGRQAIDVMRAAAPELSAADLIADADTLVAQEISDVAGVVGTHGSVELLERLAGLGVPYALVTSAGRELAAARMAAAGLTIPPVAVYGEDVNAGKPHPEGYLRAAAELSVATDWSAPTNQRGSAPTAWSPSITPSSGGRPLRSRARGCGTDRRPAAGAARPPRRGRSPGMHRHR